MFKKIVSFIAISLLLNLLCYAPVAASSKIEPEKEARFIAKVRREIAKLGLGPEAHVEIKLHDQTKLQGYLSEVTADHFTVTSSKTGTATTVLYPQVKKVKGNNLSTGAKIAIGVGVVIGVLLLFGLIAAKSGD